MNVTSSHCWTNITATKKVYFKAVRVKEGAGADKSENIYLCQQKDEWKKHIERNPSLGEGGTNNKDDDAGNQKTAATNSNAGVVTGEIANNGSVSEIMQNLSLSVIGSKTTEEFQINVGG